MSDPKKEMMSPEREQFLNLREKPARVTMYQATHVFNCAVHDIRVWVAKGLLKPLGNPADNATKFFAYDVLQELKHDVKWLAKATVAINDHWKMKNANAREDAEQFSSQNESERSSKSAMQRA